MFKPWGMLAYVGGYKAIHDLPVDKSKGMLKAQHAVVRCFSESSIINNSKGGREGLFVLEEGKDRKLKGVGPGEESS